MCISRSGGALGGNARACAGKSRGRRLGWHSQGGDVYATGHREGRLASLDHRMTSLGALIGSGKSQNVNKAAATAAIY